jgi:hypothetical protein
MELAGMIETLFYEKRTAVNSLGFDDGLPSHGAGKAGI